MGELHLEVIVDRMLREFGVEANVGRPAGGVQGDHHPAPSRPRGASCARPAAAASTVSSSSRSSRCERGAGFEFENKIVGGAVPKEFIKPTEDGVRSALESGVVAGYPVIDVRVHAGRRRLPPGRLVGNGVQDGRLDGVPGGDGPRAPVLLEPVMKVEISTPDQFFGDVLGDINARRGQSQDVETFGTLQIIRAMAPLAETFGYATELRSMTQGRASYTMEFDHYEEVPAHVAEKLGARAKVRR